MFDTKTMKITKTELHPSSVDSSLTEQLPLPEPDVVGLDVDIGSKNMQSSAKNA
jgi:hypothetical protein